MSDRIRRGVVVLLALGLAMCLAVASAAQEPLSVSPDVSTELGIATLADEDVAADDQLGTIAPSSLGSLPDGADVTAYHLFANGDQLVSFDTTVALPGPLYVRRADVVRYDGAAYTLEFDAASAGVPDGAVVDAVAELDGMLLLSFDTSVAVGNMMQVFVDDEDLVSWDGADFTLFLDGSVDAGVPDSLDLDGIHAVDQGNQLLVSFDGSGSVGGVPFADEDVLRFDFVESTWTLVYDGSALHGVSWDGADVDAVSTVPEPAQAILLAAGLAGLLGLERRRSRL
jgi:hypothetical protein